MKNVNLQRVSFYTPCFGDGVVQTLPVDDFPVKDKSNYKINGFPRSDMSILDRFSRSNVSREQIEMIASRLQELQAQKDDGLSDDEKLKVLRPSWVQTASEYAQYEEMVYSVLSERKEQLSKDDKQSLSVEQPADVQPVGDNGSDT